MKSTYEHLEGMMADRKEEMVQKEWFFPFNRFLGLDPTTTPCASTKHVYWQCPKCSSRYRMSPRERCNRAFRNQESCYYCRGRRQKHPFTV